MKAMLNSGEIVQLQKDCGCVDSLHSEHVPHWVHMDRVDRDLNRQYLDRPAAFQVFARCELVRLRKKAANMQAGNIDRLIQEEGDVL